jgi:hypothetical protein
MADTLSAKLIGIARLSSSAAALLPKSLPKPSHAVAFSLGANGPLPEFDWKAKSMLLHIRQ